MHDGGQRLHSIDQSGAGPNHQPVGVDGPYGDSGQLANSPLGLRRRVVKVEPQGATTAISGAAAASRSQLV